MKGIEQKGRTIMAPKQRRSGLKGFASMDEERKKRFARKGGLASARTKKTSNRGFASMDKTKLKQISSMGGKASKAPRGPRTAQNEEDAESKDMRERAAAERDLNSLEEEDDLESSKDTKESLEYSETDEDEDEGLGDGNLGRSTRGDVSGK